MAKKNNPKKELAKMYYMNGESGKVIAGKVGVTETTISKWVQKEGWKEHRAAMNITRPELVNKILMQINHLLDMANESKDPDAITNMGDKLSKLASTVERLDKKSASVVDVIEVFTDFVAWLQIEASEDSQITVELLQRINDLQNRYIMNLTTN